MKKLGIAINHQYAANCTEELVIELILALDPEKEPELRKDEHYGRYMK
jgi:protein-tyrosine-phosphatase